MSGILFKPKRRHGFAAAAAIAGCLYGALTWAAEPPPVRAHIGYGAEHPLAQSGWRAFGERLAREPAGPKVVLYLNGPPPEDPEAIGNLGRGDYAFGAAALPAFARDFPYAALLSELGLVGGDDELAATAAATELMALDCAACIKAFQAQRIVFLGAYSAARYVMISSKPVATLEGFKGLNVLTPGSAWDRLAAGLGGVAADA